MMFQVEGRGLGILPDAEHVHLIAVPPSKEALPGAVAEAHRRCTCRVNLREGWTGHLWQGRFSSFPLDEAHLYTATRYIELNPASVPDW